MRAGRVFPHAVGVQGAVGLRAGSDGLVAAAAAVKTFLADRAAGRHVRTPRCTCFPAGVRCRRQPQWHRPVRAIANLPKATRAAYKGATPYTLRHSRASHLIESGTDYKAVADILGDTPMTVLNRYVHPTPEHIARALE